MRYTTSVLTAVALIGGFTLSGLAQAGTVFDSVKQKGFVQCGLSTGVPGYSAPDSKGNWTGLDVDTCRAIAGAIFGDTSKIKVTPLNSQQRFTALQSGEVDVLIRYSTFTQSRDTTLGLTSTAVNYYDGQGFMVPNKLGVKSAKELDGATVCLQSGTTTELNLADYFRANKMTYKPVVVDNPDEAIRSFTSGRCDVYTTDKAPLASARITMIERPDDYLILPEVISKEPTGPMVRQGDKEFENLVKWTVYGLIEAEELGVTSKNVDEMRKSPSPAVQRLLGVQPGVGKNMGVRDDWVVTVVRSIGNYGEIFDRNMGKDSPLKLDRGLNALWKDGGLMYAWPMR